MTDREGPDPALYDAFARRLVAGGVITDPWLDGAERFETEPLVLEASALASLYRAAESIAEVYDELCLIVADNPDLLDEFLCLSPYQRAMWLASEPRWHGIARADLFFTEDGIAAAELNCDTPTGEAEAVILSALAAEARSDLRDPNAGLEARFAAMLEASMIPGAPRVAGVVYPTELTEDLSVIRLYKQWLEAAGYEVILGSPYNLAYEGSALRLFQRPFSLMLRHYKTDWWGERASAFTDEPILDGEPLKGPVGATLDALLDDRVAIVNPFGSVVPQNKRAMALMWEHIHRFSPGAQAVIERFIPVTSRLEAMHHEQLFAEREAWVMKSDYGAEGDEVILGASVSDAEWRAAIERARPGRWIAQQRFLPKLDARGEEQNLGIFVVAGRAAGVYARVSAGSTDVTARSVPVLIKE